ncbi:MAG TPA: glutaminyl-peptide cyclotransferase [Actinomycetota bacterium]|nr:glutaminyl-peptide cyclotransferase [Actinomycetota bacterium]
MRFRHIAAAVAAVVAAVPGCSSSTDAQPAGLQESVFPGYVVVGKFPHDPAAYTQGFDFRREALFEGTGLNGRSSLRRVDLETGEVLRQVDLAERFFGEGIVVLGRRIYQLTWQSERAFVYDRRTFRRIRRFTYEGEGWGLTHDGRRLIMSDGTSTIEFRDPDTFEVTGQIEVTEEGQPVSSLNELEWVNGEIFANVYPTDDVVRIDPDTGEVTGHLDLSPLKQQEPDGEVTNGIAYMESQDRLFVTGKLWSSVYEIELTDLP